MVDGCTRVGAFFRITFPLLAPGLVATGVFGFIQAWNEFTLALVVMTNAEKRTLPVWLSTFSDTNRGTDWGAVMAGSTLIAIPVIVFFLIVQGRMVAGMTAGRGEGMSADLERLALAVQLPSFPGTRCCPMGARCSRRVSAGSACSAATPPAARRRAPDRRDPRASPRRPSSRPTRRAATSPDCTTRPAARSSAPRRSVPPTTWR